MTGRLVVRSMMTADLRLTLEWADAEGWNPGLDDAKAFHSADPEGFLMGWLDGEPIVSVAAVAYGPRYGFIGLYICRPDMRGRGFGAALARAALERLAGRTIGLDGVLERVDNYSRLGFAYAHENRRYGGRVGVDGPDDGRIVAVSESLVPLVLELDRTVFGAPRDSFLRPWLGGAPGRQALAIVDDGRVSGYGLIRDCGEGRKIGPLFAATASDADLLFRGLAALRPSETVFIDVPEPNAEGIALAERYGMTQKFATARMYRGPVPNAPLDQTFGITTFELG